VLWPQVEIKELIFIYHEVSYFITFECFHWENGWVKE
jgi:hypothetical protein